MQIHVVEPGDNLTALSRLYNVPVKKLIIDNNLSDPSAIAVGQALLIAKPLREDTVRYGDDIYNIAARNRVEVNTLLQYNPELATSAPVPGDSVVIDYGDPKNYSMAVMGYTYSYIDKKVLDTALPYLTYVIVFGYGFNGMAQIMPVEDDYIIKQAKLRGVKVLLSLSTLTDSGAFDNPYLDRMLTDRAFADTVTDGMMTIIRDKGADGLDIDMEYIPPEYKDGFLRFIRRASDECHRRGYVINVALAPKEYANQPGLLYEAHDYREIGEYADTVFLMTYEWGYKYGPPMAVAPLPSVRRVLEYAVTEIPPAKIILGIPNYGYDWKLPYIENETTAETISNVVAANRAKDMNTEILYNPASAAPFYYYNSAKNALDPGYSVGYGNRDAHVVWFEDVRSVKSKFELAAEKRILGVGYWNIMYPFNQNYLWLAGNYGIFKV
jgi:spore germination protein